MRTPNVQATLKRLNAIALRADKPKATEAERSAAHRAMITANAILRDRQQHSCPLGAITCSLGIAYAARMLRGETV